MCYRGQPGGTRHPLAEEPRCQAELRVCISAAHVPVLDRCGRGRAGPFPQGADDLFKD